jgi:hypothetical protein
MLPLQRYAISICKMRLATARTFAALGDQGVERLTLSNIWSLMSGIGRGRRCRLTHTMCSQRLSGINQSDRS